MTLEKGKARKGTRADGRTLKPGYGVALVLKEGTAPSRCYVGEVQEVDEHGVRLSLIDWFIGEALGWDFFAPWDSIAAALVCTPHHSSKLFGEEAAEFQVRCKHMVEGEEAIEQAIGEYRELKARATR